MAFYAYPKEFQPVGTHAVYRFWSGTLNTHFYTTSPTERDKLLSDYGWTYESVAWYDFVLL